MTDIEEHIEARERLAHERWQAIMNRDFDPRLTPNHTPHAQDRMVAALEYSAYQLGQINRRLERLVEISEMGIRQQG